MKTWVRQCVEHEDPGMSLELYGHPFSSYCQKVLIALYEKDVAFAFRILGAGDTKAGEELEALWPLKRIPVLVDAGRVIAETTIIIEHLDLNHTGKVRLIPADAHLALNVRLMDRVFDNYVSTPMQKIVLDSIRAPEKRDARGVADARAQLDVAYRWLDVAVAGRDWAAGDSFSLADCSAAPALFYADWVHPIGPEHASLRAYRQRLLARPSYARAVDEARPYRPLFPPGAPDRD
jgi:glutathione S-transferase